MFISVIVPLYNKEQWVAATIQSVLDQSHGDFELIIVDDGSTDSSVAVAESFQDGRVHVIQQLNQGVSAARNRGVREALSDWVAFLDADDRWDKQFLERCVKLQAGHEGVLFGTNTRLGDTGKTAFSREGADPWIIEDFCVAATGCEYPPIPNASCMVQKQALLRAGGFPFGIALGEDTDTWVRVSLEGRIVLDREPLIHYEMGDPESAVRRLTPRCSPSYPPSIATYRRLKSALSAERRVTFEKYVRFLIRQQTDICMASPSLENIWDVLRHHGDVGGFSTFTYLLKSLVLKCFYGLRRRLAIRTRVKRVLRSNIVGTG